MHTKIVSLLAVAFSLGLAQAASAADMPRKAPVYKAAPVAVFNWTGCYIGAQGAYKFGNTQPTDPVNGANWTDNFRFSGFIGGGTLGCNYQTGAWVFGVEGDGSWGTVKGNSIDLQNPTVFDTELKERWLATARARVGYSWDRALVYVTGGGAWAGTTFSFPCLGPIPGCALFTTSKTVSGWTVGLGLEYALVNNWTLKGEWLYVDFGTPTFIAASVATGIQTDPANVRLHQNLVRIGLNYKFWP